MITLTHILTKKQKLLEQLERFGFINLNLAIYQGALYFLVDQNPTGVKAPIEADFLLERIYQTILGCKLRVRMRDTTEESFWLTLQEHSASIDNITLLLQKLKLSSTDDVTFPELQERCNVMKL